MKTSVPAENKAIQSFHSGSVHANLKEGRVIISPEGARIILAEANFKGQRPARKHHITLLAHIMKDGRWSPGSQLAFCLYDGCLFLTNGQHRLYAVIESGVAQTFQVLITPCSSMAEVEADYHRHDVIARKRTVAEIMNSTNLGEESGLPRTFLTSLYAACSLLENNLNFVQYQQDPTARDVDRRLQVISEWMVEAKIYEELIREAPRHVKARLMYSGVMAVALMTIRHQPSKATQFWRGVAQDDGLRRGDPRKALLIDMESRGLSSGSLRQRVVPAMVAWNAFFDGRELRLVKVLDSAVIALRGTPITGKAKP